MISIRIEYGIDTVTWECAHVTTNDITTNGGATMD